MTARWKLTLLGLATTAAAVLAPAASQAACGDLNNDGSRTIADAIILSQCIANGGTCPAVTPGPLCGTGTLAGCGDIYGDGDTSFPVGQNADLAALLQSLAGLSTLYDVCTGPGPNVACPGGTATLGTQTISSSQTWPKTCKVVINGTLFVDTPAGNPTTVLRIEKGSVVKANPASVDPPALIVLRGSHVDFQGTQSEPIVMTSTEPAGSRTQGSWGGLMINGKSTVNGPNCEFQTEGLPTPFGGCISNDYSGIISFLRAEYGGIDFTPNNELNDITFNAVGSQSQFNFIQGLEGADDCIEWFGGTANYNHLVSAACGDDAFDSQLGFTGAVQYGVYLQNGAFTDLGADSRGFEQDNSEYDNNALPRNNPTYCNFTVVGGTQQAPEFPANNGSDVGAMLRRGLNIQIANTVISDFADAGLEIRDASTTQQACVDGDSNGIPESLTGSLIVRNSCLYNNGNNSAGGGAVGGEQAKDGDTLDCGSSGCAANGPDSSACGAAGCKCDTETWYSLLVSGFNVVPANGTVGTPPGYSSAWPALDNSDCTALETPHVCCTGAGTGSCRALPDLRAPGCGVPAYNCALINPLLQNAGFVGGLNPGASCVTTGAGAHCDWMTKPWISFAVQ